MDWRLVKQPNGRYARFCDTVNDFTQYDMTQEEVLHIGPEFWDVSKRMLQEKIGIADASPELFGQEIETIRLTHGKARADDQRKMLGGGEKYRARTSSTSFLKETGMTCPDCGKEGIKHLAMHTRYCPGEAGKKANAAAAAKKASAAAAKKKTPPPKPTPPSPPKRVDQVSGGTNVAALLLSKAEEHRAKAADHLEKAEKLEDMAKEAKSLL